MNNINKELNSDSKPLSLIDVFLIFIKYKKKIIIITIISCLISIFLYFFVFDLIYASTSSIKSSGKSSGLLGALSGGLPDIGGLGDDIGLGMSKSAKEMASYEEIINSRRCLEPLIVKYNLMERDESKFMEDELKNFIENRLLLKQEKLAGVMYITVFDKDPKLAKEMNEFLVSQLDKINIELNVQDAKNNREFIEHRYVQGKEDLTKAEDSLKAFQMIYGISPDLQVKASAQSAFTLDAELKMEEVKLDVLRKILSPDQVEVKTQETKIASLKSKVSEIQNSTDLSELLRLGNSPQIVMSFLRLEREVEIQGKILTFLLPLYEQAKIEEKRETPTIMILDKPFVAERKTKPKRLTMVLIWTFAGFILSFSIFLIKNRFVKYRNKIMLQIKSSEGEQS